MTLVMAIVCSAVCGYLLYRHPSPATNRLLNRYAPKGPPVSRTRKFYQKISHRSAIEGPVKRLESIHPTSQNSFTSRPSLREGRHSGIRFRAGNPPTKRVDQERTERIIRITTAVLIGTVCWMFFGGALGAVFGALVGVAVFHSFGRLGQAERQRREARLIADLPVAVDLLAACLRGGTPWSNAVEAVAEAIGGPLGEELQGVAVQIRLGADPAVAWLSLTDEPALAPLARTAVRAMQGGAPPAASLTRLARDQRHAARSAAATRARIAGIKALLPLGLCFLPAFVLLGIVPAVAGIAATLVTPW
jgi:Flp pilus assembly protein TadB